MAPAYTLAQVIERLPAHARERYETLVAEVADSKALVATLMDQFEAAQKEYRRLESRHDRAIRTGSAEATELQAELDALAARGDKLERERHRRNGIATNSEQILIRIRSFLEAKWLSGSSNISEPPRGVSVPGQIASTARALPTPSRGCATRSIGPGASCDGQERAVTEGEREIADHARGRPAGGVGAASDLDGG